MRAPNDPNPPPPEFALSPSPAGPASGRPLAKPPAVRRAEPAVEAVEAVSARGEPERPENEARREQSGGFGARVRKLLGREPTGPELAEFVRVRDALGLRDNDALWLVLLALHHQRRQFEHSIDGQRRQFEHSIDLRLANAKATAEAIIETARAQFLRDFPAALKQAARKVAVRALGFNGPVVLTGLIAGLALLIVGLGGAGWLAYALGERAGYERGALAQRAEAASKPPAPAAKGR